MINKKIVLTCLLGGVILLSGCGEKKKEETVNKEAPAKAAVIKVTKNIVKKDAKKEVSKENGGQFYYSYNKEDDSKESKAINKYNSQTSNTRTTIDAYLHIKSPYERVRITLMIKRLSRDYIIKCSACHDDYANGVIGPSLLDKNKDFIYKRILAFKTGEKKNVLMKELVSQIDDKTLENIAQEIANFNKQIMKMRNGK